MSKEEDLAFLRQVAEDDALHEKFLALAAEAKHEYSVKELTDDELDQAVGGVDLQSTSSLSVEWKFDTLRSIAGQLSEETLLGFKSKLLP